MPIESKQKKCEAALKKLLSDGRTRTLEEICAALPSYDSAMIGGALSRLLKPRPWIDLPAGKRVGVRVQLARAALKEARGSVTAAAAALGLDRSDFHKFIRAHGLADFARELRVRLRGHDRGRQWESEKTGDRK